VAQGKLREGSHYTLRVNSAKDLASTLRAGSVKDLTFSLRAGFAKIQMLRCAQHDRSEAQHDRSEVLSMTGPSHIPYWVSKTVAPGRAVTSWSGFAATC